MKIIYSLSVRSYSFLVRIASLWNVKAKKWMQGRVDVWEDLANWQRKDTPVYWFHCASLGEFEQGRPVMEKLKSNRDCQIIITFFSPSGYEIRKNYEGADLVVYLPRETNSNVKRFLSMVQPELVFFIKYEFWATYLFEAKKRGAKTYSISAVFRKNQVFFKWYAGFMRSILKSFDQIFTQDKVSAELLQSIKIDSIVAGDTRYDRVLNNASKVKPYPEIEQFIDDSKVFVVGSSWKTDEDVILPYLDDPNFDWKIIIAPHEVDQATIHDLKKKLKKSTVLYSELTENNAVADVLIIDNIGMLMNVYQYADLAYVGGAFGKGLHNILEPACFNVPVIFGYNYSKFIEATDFINNGIGYSVSDKEGFKKIVQQLEMQDMAKLIQQFMEERRGATEKIVAVISNGL
ncbi:3-deoxy-D-manno-octulosonic acid transferase [Crocinitomix sp.]|nr:3-deoxy-D-manno-octulosonic acid transferase [Crocinitomix sp.]